jgi:hypothetical protein
VVLREIADPGGVVAHSPFACGGSQDRSRTLWVGLSWPMWPWSRHFYFDDVFLVSFAPLSRFEVSLALSERVKLLLW